MIDERNLIERIDKIFPGRTIYAQSYMRDVGILGIEVRKHAKERNMSSIQWLTSQGFSWKETGYVEPDMRPQSCTPCQGKNAGALEIADSLFRRFPLVGEYCLTNEENEILYQAACDVVKKLLQKDGHVTEQERTILTAATIERLKNWSSEREDEEGSNTFWNYIFLQYGFNAENPDAAGAKTRLYNQFQKTIEGTLSRYNRFFAPPGTHRYYTSLLSHAVAPVYSVYRLFNILFSFYANNLDYQYLPEDTSYQMFVKGMLARGSAEKKPGEDIKLRSDVLSAAQETLFRERPGYMATLCDSIVRKIDAILRGEEKDLEPEKNRWDELLMGWYSKKSASEKVSLQGERKRRKTEYVATSKDRIYVQYAFRDAKVGIAVPRIRLPEVGGKRPYLTVFQGMDTIYERELSVTGNDLLLTTKSYFIPLSETSFDFTQAPDLRVEIEYLDEVLYESGRKLRCNYIVFDDIGNCRVPKRGMAYVFTGENSAVDFDGEEGVLQCNHPGQLYRVNLSQVMSVAVDGEELFVNQTAAGSIRHHSSIRRVQFVHACEGGQNADIFPEDTVISVIIPAGENIKRYQISIDGVHHPAMQFQGEENELAIPSAGDDGMIHRIRIIDVETGQVKDEYLYTVKNGFELELDRTLYRPGVDDVGVTVNYQGSSFQTYIPLLEDSYRVKFSLPLLNLDLEVHAPVVFCSFLGKNAFTSENVIWHKDIPADEFSTLSLPGGWEGKLMLGVREVPAVGDGDRFDLGNYVRSMNNTPDEVDLWLSLKSEAGERINEKITTIRFAPTFVFEPLEVLEDQDLLWLPKGSFIGDPGTQFRVAWSTLDHQESSYDVSTDNLNLLRIRNYPKGIYKYRVFIKKKSLFSAAKEEEICCGDFAVGDPKEFAYVGKEIELVKALCWNFEEEALQGMQIKQNCGIAAALKYIGDSVPQEETISVPCYTATLFFETMDGRRIPFSHRETDQYEEVNPVKIHIINEHLLILQSSTGDAVYVDSKYSSIASKKPEVIMSADEMRTRLKVPDYFEYVVREVSHNV